MTSGGRIRLIFIFIATAVGVFWLPWHVPVSEASQGLFSYTYGFNNKVAQLSLAVGLFAIFLSYLCFDREIMRVSQASRAMSSLLQPLPTGRDANLFRSWLSLAAISVILMACWYFCVPFSRYGEMACFLSRIDLLILHRAAYYQFPFFYGPGMIYPPYFLYQIANGVLSVEQSYLVCLLLQWFFGYYLFYYCIRMLFPEGQRLVVFWLIGVTFLNPTLGMNYTPLRFLLPLASLLWVHSAVVRRIHWGWVAGAAFVSSFISWELSPEVALASTLSLCTYFVCFTRTRAKLMLGLCAFPLLGGAMAVAPWSDHYLGVLFSFGGELPILPGPGLIVLLAAAFFFIPRAAFVSVQDDSPVGAAGLAMCVQLGIMLIPSLSRVDLGHVYVNSIGLFLVALALLARLSGRAFHLGVRTLFFLFGVVGWCFLFHYSYEFKGVLAAHAEMRTTPGYSTGPQSSRLFHYSKPFPPRIGMEPLLAYGPLALPLGAGEDIERYLKLTGHFAPEYYPSYQPDVYTPAQAAAELQALDIVSKIIVPKSSIDGTAGVSAEQQTALDQRFLTINELFPVRLRIRNARFSPEEFMAAGIKKEYHRIGAFREYYIMARNGPAPTEASPATAAE